MIKRTCKKCGETKPLEEFEKNKRCKRGRTHRCLDCKNKYGVSPKGKAVFAKYRASPKGKEMRRKYRTNPKNKEAHKVYCADIVKKLDTSYIKQILSRRGVARIDITPEMVELQRESMIFNKLKRELTDGINSRGNKRTETNGKTA